MNRPTEYRGLDYGDSQEQCSLCGKVDTFGDEIVHNITAPFLMKRTGDCRMRGIEGGAQPKLN